MDHISSQEREGELVIQIDIAEDIALVSDFVKKAQTLLLSVKGEYRGLTSTIMLRRLR